MDDEVEATQWTERARVEYLAASADAIDALREHIELTRQLTGRQKEVPGYFASASDLRSRLSRFVDAEFDWCGSVPFGRFDLEDDEDDEEEDEVGTILSVFGRWDFVVEDEAAIVAAGRAAYLRSWPDDTAEDAETRVTNAGSAALEVVHTDGIDALRDVDGMWLSVDTRTYRMHDDDGDIWDDPFALARDD